MERNRITRIAFALVLALAGVTPLTAWSVEPEALQVARYSTIAPVPSAAQADPLNAVVTMAFPEQLTTVGEALEYTLRRSGYRLASPEASDPAVAVLANQSLPAVHRRLGPITVARALSALAGPSWSLVVDPVHRLVSFDLTQEYAAIGVPHAADPAEPSRDSPAARENTAPTCDANQNSAWC